MAQAYHQYHHHDSFHNHTSSSSRAPVSPLLPSQRLLLRTSDRDAADVNPHLVSPMMSRSPSIASDSRFSALSGGTGTFPANPADVRPAAAYVAPFGAAQVVSEYQATRRSFDDEENLRPSKEDVEFSPPALALVNAFLDQLLFSFLSAAKSTNLAALRSAVTDILKHKLARDAIASADTELKDLLAGGDEDEDNVPENDSKWDLELVWKRTRLRVMVYMRLGEMEDEDEERHVKEQELYANGERGRFSSTAGLVSWSAAIFLTSVLEHVAEQTLQVAGVAALSRMARRDHQDGSKNTAHVQIDEQDAERIALNPALGRLWRSWRKTMRANVRPTTPAPLAEVVPFSPDQTVSVNSPRDSFGTAPESAHGGDEKEKDPAEVPDASYPEHVIAANIRLPIGDHLRDIDEIEVPGLARDPSEVGSDGTRTPVPSKAERRKSFSNYLSRRTELLRFTGHHLDSADESDNTAPPRLQRRRSNSVPMPNQVAERSTPRDAKTEKVDEDAEKEQKKEKLDETEPKIVDEDVDKRKSLIDIKAMLASGELQRLKSVDETTEPQNLKSVEETAESQDPVAVNETTESKNLEPEVDTTESNRARAGSTASDQSFTLGDKDKGVSVPKQPIAEPQHMPSEPEPSEDHDLDQIGVATTSDQMVAPERTPSAAGSRSASAVAITRETASPVNIIRSNSRSPIPNLSRTSSAPRSKYASAEEIKQPATNEVETSTIPAETKDVSQRDRPVLPSEQTLAKLRESVQRASSPQYVPQNETSQTRQASTKRNSTALHSATVVSAYNTNKPLPEPVVEHPAVQRTLSKNDKQRKSILTSASIRGPEDFDQFVQSDDVVKYTLTPAPIRDAPDSNAQSLAQLTGQVPEVVSPTRNESVDGRTGRSLSSRPATSATGDNAEELAAAAAAKKRNRWSVTRPISRNSSVHRKSGLMARDARVMTESTRDFADFIRSTKPDKEPEYQTLNLSNKSTSALSNRNSTNYSLPRSQSLTSNSDRTRSLTRSDIAKGHAPPVPIIPSKSQPLMPSSANATSGQNGGLVSSKTNGPDTNRMSRSAAPAVTSSADALRNKRISSQFNPLGSSPPDRALPNPRASVINGASNVGNIAHPAYSGKPQALNAAVQPQPEPPEKKRYRNKDPYALDFDDDEFDDDIAVTALPKGQQHGESFAEFLRSTETGNKSDSKPIASESSLAQAREIRERARANMGSRNNSSYATPTLSNGISDSVSTTALPPPRTTSVPDNNASAGRAADRLGYSGGSGTRELADFLRDSGPRTASAPAPEVGRGVQAQKSAAAKEAPPKKEKKRFFFFGRRNSTKQKGRHADMP